MRRGGWKALAAVAALGMLSMAACSSRSLGITSAAGREGASSVSSAAVTTDHNDLYRSGQYVVAQLTFARARRMHLDGGFAGKVDGEVYAQPLYWPTAGPAHGELVVATESNVVEALDALTSRVLWKRALAPPVPASLLPCGNISPVGVTGTPAIDPAAAAVYVSTNALVKGSVKALVYGLSLANGRILPGWPVDVGASLARTGFTPSTQGQRSALTVWQGRVYIPYGGRYGDCGTYHGVVAAIDLSKPRVVAAWRTQADKGGVWAVGGAVVADGALFVGTGNTQGATRWGGGDAIVRLSATLGTSNGPRGFFAPADWPRLDAEDLDLGGSNPMPLDFAGRRFIVALGKDGNAYVADRERLGGIGGELARAQVSQSEIITGPASWVSGGNAYIAFAGEASAQACTSRGREGLTVIRVSAQPKVTTAWCAALDGDGSPIVTTSDGTANRIVWIVGAEGDDLLHGFDARNGSVVFAGGGPSDAMRNVHHMSTILAAAGRLYVPADDRIYAFTP